MKIIDIHKTITSGELLHAINQKLDPLFERQRQMAMHFTVVDNIGAVEILQPDFYEGFLFRIEIKGDELEITRSEDYVDDVNSLTVESILNEIFAGLARDGEVTFVLEG
jgi:hypothetical protein